MKELADREDLEFEKETKNTFISLLMSIQEKRRSLNMESLSHSQYSGRSSNVSHKKRHRRSMINLDSSNLTVSSFFRKVKEIGVNSNKKIFSK